MLLTRDLLQRLDDIDSAQKAYDQAVSAMNQADIEREVARDRVVTLRSRAEELRKILESRQKEYAAECLKERAR